MYLYVCNALIWSLSLLSFYNSLFHSLSVYIFTSDNIYIYIVTEISKTKQKCQNLERESVCVCVWDNIYCERGVKLNRECMTEKERMRNVLKKKWERKCYQTEIVSKTKKRKRTKRGKRTGLYEHFQCMWLHVYRHKVRRQCKQYALHDLFVLYIH